MNREIKFRAWDKKEKKMYYFGLGDLNCGVYFGNCSNYVREKKMETVMQLTGLKDKNGKEIYEGDIVNYMGKHLIVGFANGHFMIHYGNRPEDIYKECHEDLWKAVGRISKDDRRDNEVEVIGNIYEENPELLN